MKAVVIRKANDSLSEQLADECIESANNFGIVVTKVDGVYQNHDEIIKEHNLFPYPKILNKKIRPSYVGCFLSHYLLWRECVSSQQPILIFEHDALMIRPLPNDILDTFDTILNLDISSRIVDNYEDYLNQNINFEILSYPRITFEKIKYRGMNMTHIKGIHAYIIKPHGAEALLTSINNFGFIAADVAINQYYVNFYATKPSYARINPFFCDKKNIKEFSHTRGINQC